MALSPLRKAWLPALTGALLITSSTRIVAQCEQIADQELYASDGVSWDQYGRDVDIASLWVASGAPGADGGTGVVYVYDRGPNPTEYRIEPVIAGSQQFGWSVANWGNWLAVGDPGWNSGHGRVDLFRYDKFMDQWQFAGVISGSVAGDELGYALTMDGGRLAVGSPGEFGVGRVRLYELVGGSWQSVTTLLPNSVMVGMDFGAALSYTIPLLVIGSPNPSGVGVVDVFQWNGAGVRWMDDRADPDLGVGERFAASVHTDGVKAIVGKPLDSEGGAATGAAWIMRTASSNWYFDDKLIPIGGAFSQAGTDVRIDGDRAWIGAPGFLRNGSMTGAVHLFKTYDDFNWLHQTNYFGFTNNGLFGLSLDLDGDELYVGAPYEWGKQVNTGSIYQVIPPGFDLMATPSEVNLFDPIVATACAGIPGNLLGLIVTGVEGTPVFIPLVFDVFGASGQWSIFGTHDNPAYSGLDLDLVGLTLDSSGKVAWSNPINVAFD